MKTRMLAMACVRGSVDERSDHAWGFVSRIMVKSDGGMPAHQRQHCCAVS